MECLHVKLKESVNNPDLPVLETMQQFTLDVIANSGNSTMTDAQKWALNHFFYQIGAIDDNGAYSKLKVLILPMIAGNKNGALRNIIVDGPTATSISKKVSLLNHGLVSTDSSNQNAANYDLVEARALTDAFICAAKNAASSSMQFGGERNGLTINVGFTMSKTIVSTSNPYATYSTIINGTSTLDFNACGCINYSTPDIKAAGGSSVESGLVNQNHMATEATGVTVNKLIPLARTDGGLCAACCGFNLSDNESVVFLTALNELYNEFVA